MIGDSGSSMPMAIQDEPAFPQTVDSWYLAQGNAPAPSGMGLRDWFAGMVISPMLVQAYGTTPKILAERAYEIADAMMLQRAATESLETLARDQRVKPCKKIEDFKAGFDLLDDDVDDPMPTKGKYGEPYEIVGNELESAGTILAHFSNFWPGLNARECMERIVATVNAMAGIPHPASFVGNARRLAEIARACPLHPVMELDHWHTTTKNVEWIKTLLIYANEFSFEREKK